MVPPDDACILSTFCTISSLYDAVSFCSLINSTTSETSLSETNAPCTRIGFGAPCGWNSISPFPRSFSAPFISRIVRESVPEVTENAIRLGIFALIRPVMTFTDGRWVAITSRQMASSTSLEATIIRSASSSTMITICGIFCGRSCPSGTSMESTFALYPLISRTFVSANFSYRSVISATAQCKAPDAFFGSVTTGIIRCGIPL